MPSLNRRRPAAATAVAAAVTFLASSAFAATLAPGGYRLQQVGLYGPGYQYTDTGTIAPGINIGAFINGVSAQGFVAGTSTRYTPTGTSIGSDAWFYNGTTTVPIGLTGGYYDSTLATGFGYRSAGSPKISSGGSVAGVQNRITPGTNSASLGADAYLFDGTTSRQIGFTGPDYEFTNAAGFVNRSSSVYAIDPAGRAYGTSNRLVPTATTSTSLGTDAWVSDGTTTTRVPAPSNDPAYQYTTAAGFTFRFTGFAGSIGVVGGKLVGSSTRYTPAGGNIGTDAWVYDTAAGGAPTLVAALPGVYQYADGSGNLYRTSAAAYLAPGGVVAGTVRRLNATPTGSSVTFRGTDAFLYSGGSTKIYALTGSPYEYTGTDGVVIRDSAPSGLSSTGVMVGRSLRFMAISGNNNQSAGQDAWISSGDATTRIGFTGGAYEYQRTLSGSTETYREATASFVNAPGAAVGFTKRFNAAGSSLGQDAWVYRPTGSTTQVGLTGPGYEFTNGNGLNRTSTPLGLTDTGWAFGTSSRYNAGNGSNGTAAWAYDAATDTTYPVVGGVNLNGYALINPLAITDAGVLIGNYLDLTGLSTTSGGTQKLFAWSLDTGFVNLNTVTDPTPADLGWFNLQTIAGVSFPSLLGTTPDGAPFYLTGTGRLVGQSQGTAGFLLTAAVPEPASLGLLMLPAAALLRRGRR